MKKDFSPEEKLLRLIRNAGKKSQPRDEAAAKRPEDKKPEDPKPEAPKALNPEAPKQDTAGIKREAPRPEGPKIEPEIPAAGPRSVGRPHGAEPVRARAASISMPFSLKGINIRTFNALLIVILSGLILYFVYDIVYTAFYRKAEIRVIVDDVSVTTAPADKDAIDAKPYSYYSSSVGGRNIFMPQQVEVEQVVTGPSVDEIKAGLSLIGIIAGARPQAIIEEKKTGKSYFLYMGGTVGESQVVEITDDSVVLEYQGQRFELIL